MAEQIALATERRSDIERSVGRLLEAQSQSDVEEELTWLAARIDAASKVRDDIASRADHCYSRDRATRQVLLASIFELACRKAVDRMSRHFATTGSLLPDSEASSEVDQEEFSPSCRRFLQAMDF